MAKLDYTRCGRHDMGGSAAAEADFAIRKGAGAKEAVQVASETDEAVGKREIRRLTACARDFGAKGELF